MKVPVKLVFSDWLRGGRSVYATELGVELSAGLFHSGTTFEGSIELDIESYADLMNARRLECRPTFLLLAEEPAAFTLVKP